MIRESRFSEGGWAGKLQFAVMTGKRKKWLLRREVPEEWVLEYRNWVNEAGGRPDADGKYRGPMIIVGEIDEETERLAKLKRPPKGPLVRPELVVQETQSSKGKKQVAAKKRQVLKIQESKQVHHETRKKLEKKKRLESLRANYSTKLRGPSEESPN